MLSNHISKLLNTNNRVIVPDLGAFIIKGEEKKSIYFNEFLRFNDGLLLGYVTDQDHIDIIEAAKLIKIFAEDTNNKLNAERSVEIEGIGTLYLDGNDKIQIKNTNFTYQDKLHSGNDAVTKNAKNVKNTRDIKNSKNQSSINETNSQPDKHHNIGYKEEIIESPGDTESIISSVNSNDEKPSRLISIITSKNVIVIAGFLVIFLVLAYILFAHQEYKTRKISIDNFGRDTLINKLPLINKNSSLIKTTAKSKPDTLTHSDSEISALTSKPPAEHNNSSGFLSKHELSGSEPIKHNSENKLKGEIKNTKKYYIVAGCFSEEVNANRLVEKLKTDGYLSEKFATIRNMYYVSYSSYFERDSASAELTKIRQKGISEAWIIQTISNY